MKKGICLLSAIPCRRDPSHKSEMVTQLLWGDLFQVQEDKGDWFNIIISADGYETWVDKKQVNIISEAQYEVYNTGNKELVVNLLSYVNFRDDKMPLVLGSTLRRVDKVSFQGECSGVDDSPSHLMEIAMQYLNAPYLWGGKTPFGIDCSGFTQMVFKHCGVQLKRDASQQAEQGEMIPFIEQAQFGDLAFFEDYNTDSGVLTDNEGRPESRRITHVGIILDNRTIIHASGKVKGDTLDHEGIFSKSTGGYTHKLRFIKRVL